MKVNILSKTVLLLLLFFISISQGTKNQFVLSVDEIVPTPIDSEIYSNMFTYAHLIDISYCISKVLGIKKPFECNLGCAERFPNMTLVYQWYFDDSVCGYISTTYDNIFNYNRTKGSEEKKKTIIISLRGTRSLFDTLTDLKVDMVKYENLGSHLSRCGPKCRVHRGFHDYYRHTIDKINGILEQELGTEAEPYELIILGHSLGGSVALFLALHYLDLGYDTMTLVTMGQPLVGNKNFINWVDRVMGSDRVPEHNTFDRKYFRVVHAKDIVTTIPRNENQFVDYEQFNNQIYINCSASKIVPNIKDVVDCVSGTNAHCISGDFDAPIFLSNYYENHNTYFRRLGLCGVAI